METYLLLRSNKKSGPYNLQELLNLGLKPYDLVWVEGKSAAWRYPSEVDLLKPYAPAAEEQPYDRFYKKPEEKKVSEPVMQVKEMPVAPVNTTLKETPVIESPVETTIREIEPRPATSLKKVFVSMPGNLVSKPVPPQPAQVITIEEKPKIIEERKVEDTPVYKIPETTINERIAYQQTALPKEEEPELSEKYSESLDDIKRRYTETYLERKKKSKRSSAYKSLAQVFGGAVFFCAVVVVLYKGFGEDAKSSQLTKTTVVQPEKNTSTTNTTPATSSNTQTTVPSTSKINKQTEKKPVIKKEEVSRSNEIPVTANTTTTKQKTEASAKRNDDLFAFDTKEVKSKTYEESKSEEVKPKARLININKLVSVRANNYKQRAFGGVMNLELTVHNDSKFALDKVIVELQYLKPSEQPIKTDRITFSSISANSSETLKIPDYLRGVKVSYRVIEIESSQYERYTAGL